MALWINCDYHGTKVQHERSGMANQPVNMDLVVSYTLVPNHSIEFIVPTKQNVLWEFINDAVRDAEYQRINDIISSIK